MSVMHTPKTNITTPMRLGKRRLAPPETPECYSKVTLETPAHKSKISKEDEVRNLTVAVRIRPMSFRELGQSGSSNIIKVHNSSIIVESNSANIPSLKYDYVFDYDHVFWSCDDTHFNYTNQEDVFEAMGKPLLDNAFRGYNACLFAYGQTGSGKTYSMMGPDTEYFEISDEAGVIPRFCQELFKRLSQLDPFSAVTINISYFEIYNEKIHDLLLTFTSNSRVALKVREHPDWGPYVVDLTTHSVKSYEELKSWLLLGNKNRATAATAMNSKSSRSHSIFSIELSLSGDADSSNPGRRSKICLVDLAGSERLTNTISNNEEKLKQGVSINKSLLTLGKVIIALADQRKGNQFVPYRDSVLTWLLRESLGGNSLTSMLATITPSSTNIDETLATLRYACQARAIVNRARINNNANDSLIRKLNSEVERLQALLGQESERHSLSFIMQCDTSSERLQEIENLKAKLSEKEEMLQLAERSWEDRYKETKQHQMQKLAEVERRKEELESHVRIMAISNESVNLEPYQSNFLEEIENVLHNDSNIINNLKNFLRNYDFDYKVTVNEGKSVLNIYDKVNSQTAICSIDEVDYYIKQNDTLRFIQHLKWAKDEFKSNEDLIMCKMNEIYDAADTLKDYISSDEKVSLAFAKFMKSVQVLESALLNSTHNVNKPKKMVKFKC